MCCVIEIVTHQTSWKVMFFALNYIITISKQDSAWLCHLQEGRLFSEGKFTEFSVGRADPRSTFSQDSNYTVSQKWVHLSHFL